MGQVDDAIAFARAQIGKPYKWGTKGPNTFDCSGLIVAAYEHATPPIRLPHWTGALIVSGKSVARSELQPGDMVFPDAGHVQLYIGSGQIIEAQQAGVPIRQGPMWGFVTGRRVVTEGGVPSKLGATAMGVLQELPGPWSVGADVADVLRPVGIAAYNVTSPKFWGRIGMGVLGAFLIVTGVLYLNRQNIMSVVSGVTRAVGNVGGTAVQGAAFGFGAGKAAPGIGAAATVPTSGTPVTSPMRTPRAPNAALGNEPVTALVTSSGGYAPRSPGGTYTVTRASAPGSVVRTGKGRKKPLSEPIDPKSGLTMVPRSAARKKEREGNA